MPSLNRVQLIGRLGYDPKGRTTSRGTKIASFSVAVDHRWKTSSGEVKKTTDWFLIELWGRLAEVALQYLKKGRLVYVEGRLKTDKYEKDGETKYFTKVIGGTLQMLEKKADDVVTETPEEELVDE